jgi:hypothetical protein
LGEGEMTNELASKDGLDKAGSVTKLDEDELGLGTDAVDPSLDLDLLSLVRSNVRESDLLHTTTQHTISFMKEKSEGRKGINILW